MTLNNKRLEVARSQQWVIKFGSAVLTSDKLELNQQLIKSFVAQIAQLIEQGKQVVIVSSGAVAVGASLLGWSKRPDKIHDLQAAASVGQAGLIEAYQQFFKLYGLQTAQILLSQSDMESRERYLNARTTIKTLLEHNVIPIINENDSISTEEICFGDNDSLASYVANNIEADSMLLLTDQDGFFDSNPTDNQHAKLLSLVSPNDKKLDAMAGAGGIIGRGGMQSKLAASRIAARSGTQTIIANGFTDDVITKVVSGANIGSWFQVESSTIDARKRWLGSRLKVSGSITVDSGATQALSKGGNSLLPIGMVSIEGQFERGHLVQIINHEGEVIARGLVNYSSPECEKLLKTHSHQIENLLGYCHAEAIVHCDNLLLL